MKKICWKKSSILLMKMNKNDGITEVILYFILNLENGLTLY